MSHRDHAYRGLPKLKIESSPELLGRVRLCDNYIKLPGIRPIPPRPSGAVIDETCLLVCMRIPPLS